MVVGGGDGTLIYLVDEMLEKGIDVLKINFCVLPFGTGNDLAQVTGWGSDASEMAHGNPISTLRSLLNELKYATISSVNVWTIEVKCAVLITFDPPVGGQRHLVRGNEGGRTGEGADREARLQAADD